MLLLVIEELHLKLFMLRDKLRLYQCVGLQLDSGDLLNVYLQQFEILGILNLVDVQVVVAGF
jgi:hypothetical protein